MRLIEQTSRARAWLMGLGALGLAAIALPFGGYSCAGALLPIALVAAIPLLLWQRRADRELRERLADERCALCPGCGCEIRYFEAGACPDCKERWTADSARRAWRQAVGARWPNLFDEPAKPPAS